jgi:hypothetical protein
MDTSKFRYLKMGDVDMYAFVGKAGERMLIDRFTWMGLRNFAASVGGWDPKGTEAPEGWDSTQRWSGAYDTAEGQLVSEVDSLGLANSLAAASFDILSVMAQVKATEAKTQEIRANLPPGSEVKVPEFPSLSEILNQAGMPRELFEARMQSSFQQFRDFFLKGAFRIRPLPRRWDLVRGGETLGVVTLDPLQMDLPSLLGSWEPAPDFASVKPLFDEINGLLAREGSNEAIDELQERIREPGVQLRSLENDDELELFVVIITGDRAILRD